MVFTFDIPLGACDMKTTQEIVDDVSTIEFRISVELPPVDGVGDVVCLILTPKTFDGNIGMMLKMFTLKNICFPKYVPKICSEYKQ